MYLEKVNPMDRNVTRFRWGETEGFAAGLLNSNLGHLYFLP